MSDSDLVSQIILFPIRVDIRRRRNQPGDVYYATVHRLQREDGCEFPTWSDFSASDLLLLAKVADLAHSKIFELQATDRITEHTNESAA